VFYAILFTAFISCSKEENIPFKNENRDTLTPTSYSNLSGVYVGNLSSFEIIGDTATRIIYSEPHTITIDQIDFDKIMIKNITNSYKADVEAFISREIGAVYLQMDESKLPVNVGTIPMFYVESKEYNGIYFFNNPKEIEYYIYITDMVDTVRQIFNGNLIQ
jgi:hypothetical protein